MRTVNPPRPPAASTHQGLREWPRRVDRVLAVNLARLTGVHPWLRPSVTAALQRAVDESGTALFLLKGGTMLRANDSLSIVNPVRVRADLLYIRSE